MTSIYQTGTSFVLLPRTNHRRLVDTNTMQTVARCNKTCLYHNSQWGESKAASRSRNYDQKCRQDAAEQYSSACHYNVNMSWTICYTNIVFTAMPPGKQTCKQVPAIYGVADSTCISNGCTPNKEKLYGIHT